MPMIPILQLVCGKYNVFDYLDKFDNELPAKRSLQLRFF